jgi:hypothetical protein
MCFIMLNKINILRNSRYTLYQDSSVVFKISKRNLLKIFLHYHLLKYNEQKKTLQVVYTNLYFLQRHPKRKDSARVDDIHLCSVDFFFFANE